VVVVLGIALIVPSLGPMRVQMYVARPPTPLYLKVSVVATTQSAVPPVLQVTALHLSPILLHFRLAAANEYLGMYAAPRGYWFQYASDHSQSRTVLPSCQSQIWFVPSLQSFMKTLPVSKFKSKQLLLR
jgi:hypothetical protein